MTETVALVTGAARGIGLAITDLFLAEGRRVVMVDRDAEELVHASNNRTPVMALPCDVSDPDQVSAMAARAADWAGRIDVVVNNAGVALSDRFPRPISTHRGG